MNALVKWVDNMTMTGESGSGHTVVMDGAIELGGKNLGARPMEMLLLGMGGCTLIDVVSTLAKMRQSISQCSVQIKAERATEHPKVFTSIELHFVIKGTDLNPTKIAKAIDLSAQKYCSASIMLGKTAVITHNFELIN